MIKIHQVHLFGFFDLKTFVFAKDRQLHLQEGNGGAEQGYSPRLHSRANNL
jgi:hypothetical protein